MSERLNDLKHLLLLMRARWQGAKVWCGRSTRTFNDASSCRWERPKERNVDRLQTVANVQESLGLRNRCL